MNIDELKLKLKQENINERFYSLNGAIRDECLILEKEDEEKWWVYYSERGLRSGEYLFGSEDEACQYFFKRVSSYKK